MDIVTHRSREEGLQRVVEVAIPALVAATMIPFKRPGLNFLILGAAVLAALIVSKLRDLSVSNITFASFGLLSLIPFVLIAADWVLALDLIAFAGFAALAAIDFSAWRDLRRLPSKFLQALVRIPTSMIAPIGGYIRGLAPRKVSAALTSTLLSATLVVIFGSLFLSADKALASFVSKVLPDLQVEGIVVRGFVFVATFIGTALLVIVSADSKEDRGEDLGRHFLAAADWKAALSLLVLLFAGFAAFQITLLSGGGDRVLSTAGLTYAEYARQGFFQLIAAASLVLVLIATVTFKRPGLDRALQMLLGTLCGLTMIILASALKRLALYESAFGFTRSRLFAHALIFWLGLLFMILIAAGLLRNYRRLPTLILSMTALSVIAFNLVNPDRMIARLNIDRYERVGKLDVHYLGTLSIDAFPEIERLPGALQQQWIANNVTGEMEAVSWMEANLSRSSARRWLDTRNASTGTF